MLAAMYNYEEIFFLYVSKYQECIHAISKNSWTALLYAAQNGNANLVSVSFLLYRYKEKVYNLNFSIFYLYLQIWITWITKAILHFIMPQRGAMPLSWIY
jgi:ankyrin repeat protein